MHLFVALGGLSQVEYCSNLGQKAQEERREVISYMRAMLTRQALHAFKGQSLHAGMMTLPRSSMGNTNDQIH